MMWVGGEGRRAFRVEKSKEQTGWLDIGQVAAKATILQAMKVMYEDKQEGLLEKIATKDKQGRPRIKNDRRNSGGTLRQKFNLIDI